MSIQEQLQSMSVNQESKLADNELLVALLTLCQQGDKAAFQQLYQKTSAQLNGIAYRITRNVDSANEVLQEAFIQIWQNRHEYQSNKSQAFTWLAAIVRYRAYDRYRHDTRRQQQNTVEFDETEHPSVNLEELGQYGQHLDIEGYSEQKLHSCLAKLELKQSQSILMAYLYGYRREDISAYFDTPVNTIKSWIRRGLGRLQLCLNK